MGIERVADQPPSAHRLSSSPPSSIKTDTTHHGKSRRSCGEAVSPPIVRWYGLTVSSL